MSAPINTRLPNKNVYNFTLRSVFVQTILLLAPICVPMNSISLPNLISNCLLSCKVITVYLIATCLCFAAFLPQSHASLSTTSTTLSKCRNLLRGLGLYILSILFFHSTAVLYGAPFFESVAETFHFAMILSSTAVLPPLCVLGINFNNWVRVFAQNKPELGPESVVHITTILSIVGAWLGAFPIPLDWDRPWQIWPITCVLGALFGHWAGLVSGGVHLMVSYRKLKKFKLT